MAGACTRETSRALDVHPYRLALRRILHRVVEQIPHGVCERFGIARHHGAINAIDAQINVMAMGRAVVFELVHHRADQRAGVERLHAIRGGPRLHPAEVEQALDQPLPPIGLSLERAIVTVALVVAHSTVDEHFGELAKRRERRAELVRDRGNEIGLEARHRQVAHDAARDDADATGRDGTEQRQSPEP